MLTVAPSPELGRRLSQARIETLLRHAGRQRNISTTAATIRAALTSGAAGRSTRCDRRLHRQLSALLAVLTAMTDQTEVLAGQVEQGEHPDLAANPASVTSSAPGCWPSSATTPTATP